MGIMASDSGGSKLPPVDAGMHDALCYAIYDLGTQFLEKFNKLTRQVMVCWELTDQRMDMEKDGKQVNLPRAVSKKYTLSLNPKSNLFKDLNSWRGKAFTKDELAGFDLRNVLGKPCQIQIIHHETDRGTYANISNVLPKGKGQKSGKTENPETLFSIDDGNKIPEHCPEWIGKMIMESTEYKNKPAGASPVDVADPEDSDIPF